jgi:hypothetical protein
MACSVGGMALSALVPATVQVLCVLAKDPTDALHLWSLHGLWLTAEAAGLSYVPHVQVGNSGLPSQTSLTHCNVLFGYRFGFSELANLCSCNRVHTELRNLW